MEFSENQKKVLEVIGTANLGEMPRILFPLLDKWISANSKFHKEFAEKKFGWKKI